MDGWNTNFFLGWPIFRGEPVVSGSVDGHQVPRVNQFWVAWESFYSLEGHYDQHFVHGDFQPEAAALGEAENFFLPGAVSVGIPYKVTAIPASFLKVLWKMFFIFCFPVWWEYVP